MIKVREMVNEDLDQMYELELECFVAPWKKSDLVYELNENPINKIYVAIIDDKIVGFIDYMVTFNSSTISQIAVTTKYRKQGIGSTLLMKMFESLPNESEEVVEFVTLEVRKSNEAAKNLYLKHGFEIITTKPSYYSNGEDAIYMVKRMN